MGFPHFHSDTPARSVDAFLVGWMAFACGGNVTIVSCVDDSEPFGELYAGVSLTDKIGIGVLTRLAHRDLVLEVINETGKREIRKRALPAQVVVYFVLALALFYGDSYEEVIRKMTAGLTSIKSWKTGWKVPTTSALAQARQRLGAEPLQELFRRVAVPCAARSVSGAFKCGRRLMSIDGFEVDAADTPQNAEYFGYSGVKKNEKSSYPKVPAMGLAECGTHALVAVELGTQSDNERELARRLVAFSGGIEPGMLVMADRGLYSYDLLTGILERGADVCFRVPTRLILPVLEWLPDGSYLSYIPQPAEKRRVFARLKNQDIAITDLPGVRVRVVDYEIPNRSGKNELFTVITNICDHETVTSVDLAEAYNERWEIEIAFDEIKTHQRGPGIILRSRSPEMVKQELYGLLITHYGVRQLMTEAADQADLDPDRLSFTRSLNIIRRQITSQAGFSPSTPPRENH